MAIVKMKSLRLVTLAEEREKLLQELLILGCVELTETGQRLSDPEWAGLVRRDETALPQYRAKLSAVNAALESLQKVSIYKKGLLSRLPEMSLEAFFDPALPEAALEAAGKIAELEAARAKLLSEESGIRASMALLSPWEKTELPLEGAGTKNTEQMLLTVPLLWDLQLLKDELANAAEFAQLEEISSDRELHYLSLIVHRTQTEEALAALRRFGVNRAKFPGWQGSAGENLQALGQRLRALEQALEENSDAMLARVEDRPLLQQAADRLNQDIAREEARGKLLLTEKTVTLEGWVPNESVPALEKLLAGYCAAWETREPAPEEYPEVPVKLKNNIFTRCLNMVTEVYSLPAYGTVDPNPLMAPFFILFYGIMMADMGYGIVMMLAGIFVLAKAKPKKGMRNFFELMFYCGITTFLFGAITGGCFGNLIPLIVETVNPGAVFEWPWPVLFTPLDDTIMILLGSLVLGFIQLITGMIVGFIRKVKNGNFLGALLDEGAWWVIYAGVALMVLGKGNVHGVPVTLAVGGLMLLIGSGRGKKGIGKFTGFFGAVYNGVTGIFSDVLSYSRLMALMLAGSVIAQVFNTIGAIPGNLFVLILVSLIGNVLNFALNLLGCFVHDLRLQCLEYFGKFYEDGGRAFSPLSINTKYVNTVKK